APRREGQAALNDGGRRAERRPPKSGRLPAERSRRFDGRALPPRERPAKSSLQIWDRPAERRSLNRRRAPRRTTPAKSWRPPRRVRGRQILYGLRSLPLRKTRRHTYAEPALRPAGSSATAWRRSMRNATVVSSFVISAVAVLEPLTKSVFMFRVPPHFFSTTRSLALRARGLRDVSSSEATIAARASPRPRYAHLSCATSDAKTFLTMRSSSEWNVITARRPPDF